MPPTDEAVRLARLQAVFYIVTGVWPIVSMRSFEAITGPKVDRWLVKTVGALVAVIGVRAGPRQPPPAARSGGRARCGRQRGRLSDDRHRLRRQAPHLAGLLAGRGRGNRAGRWLGATLVAQFAWLPS